MPSSKRHHQPIHSAAGHRKPTGFALSELMMIVVLLGILSLTANIGFQDVQRYWERQSLNAVVKDLAYWLDLVRNRGSLGTACTVTISTSSAASPGDPVATVEPSSCSPSFQLDGTGMAQLGTLAISTTPLGGATITFNTDGGASPQAVSSVNGFSAVEIAISSAKAGLRRCLVVSSGTGSIRLGGSASSSGACDYNAPI